MYWLQLKSLRRWSLESGLYVVVEEDVGIVVGEVEKVVADEAVESETRTD